MIDSLKILLFFTAGTVLGYFDKIPEFLMNESVSNTLLYIIIFLVGVGIGANKEISVFLKKFDFRIILTPLSIVIGSAIGGALGSLLISDVSVREGIAVAFGFGYYSLSSVLIADIRGETLGATALVANIARETLTLIFAPVFVKIFGKLSPIASGGATTMDTTLPVIKKYAGSGYTVIAFINGMILTALVPILVPLVLGG